MKKYFLKLFKLIAIIILGLDLCLVGFGWPLWMFNANNSSFFDKALSVFGTLLILFLWPIKDEVFEYLSSDPDDKKDDTFKIKKIL